MTRKAFLHFGGAFCGMPNGPFLTVETVAIEKPIARPRLPVTGYGARIPSPYMVQHNGRMRRVYVCQYGNAGTAYIGPSAAPIATVDLY